MTNQQYHRRARALNRLDTSKKLSPLQQIEREALRVRVFDYVMGKDRCMHGSGKTRHTSGATA